MRNINLNRDVINTSVRSEGGIYLLELKKIHTTYFKKAEMFLEYENGIKDLLCFLNYFEIYETINGIFIGIKMYDIQDLVNVILPEKFKFSIVGEVFNKGNLEKVFFNFNTLIEIKPFMYVDTENKKLNGEYTFRLHKYDNNPNIFKKITIKG